MCQPTDIDIDGNLGFSDGQLPTQTPNKHKQNVHADFDEITTVVVYTSSLVFTKMLSPHSHELSPAERVVSPSA